jgi:type I restriction enzyme M protein
MSTTQYSRDKACLVSTTNATTEINRDKACLVSTGETTLTPDERKKIMQNVVGYDISPDMVRLSLVNLYLHGFSDPHIYEYDTLSSEERWNDHFDVILANPPFMSPKGGIRPHKKFSISSNRSEVLFVDYIAEHLNPKGKAGIIVPEGVIFQSGTAYKALRKMLVEKYLYAVVSLPAGVFNPYSGVKTSILLMGKELAKKKDDILFVKIDNDGFGLGAQRNEIKGGQLAEALEVLQEFKEERFSENKMAHVVAKKEIGKNGDYNLSGERYKVTQVVSSDYKFVTFKEICEINPETVEPTTFKTDKFIYVDISSVENGTGKVKFNNLIKTSQAPSRARRKVRNNDILLSTVRPNLKAFGFVQNPPPNTVASTGFAILRAKNNFNSKFLFYNLFTDNLVNQMISMMGKGAYPSINQADVASLQIPLPPLSIQEEIVAEIEGYQRIIDGSKAVVENYKPKINIDPDWEMVELGEICDNFQYGSSKKSNSTGDIICLRMGNIQNGEIDWSDVKYAPKDEEFGKYLLKKGDVLFNRTNSPVHVGKTGIYRGEKKAVFAGYLIRLNYKRNKIGGEYLNYCLNTQEAKEFCQRVKTDGINQSNINAKTLATFRIPLPPIYIQQKIVSQIQKEQALANANKELVEIFEQKIKDRIAKVWGEKKKEYVMEDEVLSMVAEE